MKSKNFFLFTASFIVLVLALGVVAADINFSPTSLSETVNYGETSVTVNFDLVHTGVGGDYTSLTWTGTSDEGTWTLPNITQLLDNETLALSATLTGIPSGFTGTINANINVNDSGSPTEDLPITIVVEEPTWTSEFCLWDGGMDDNDGDLELDVQDVKVLEGFGDDEVWFPFDEIEVEIEVKNDGDEEIEDVEFEWGLYDEDNNEWLIDVDEEDSWDIDEGDEEIVTLNIMIDDDLELDLDELEGGKNYVLYFRASGEIADGDYEGNKTCDSAFERVEIVIEKNFMALTDLDFIDTVSCGTDIHVTADVWNIGTKNQDDVTVKISNPNLGIDEMIDMGDIDAFEKEELDVTISVPYDAEENNYVLRFEIFDEDDDLFEAKDDDQEARYSMDLTISGSCSGSPGDDEYGDVIVSAELESGGQAGELLVINAILTNTGDSSGVFTLNAAGYTPWASTADISPSSLTLDAGESGTALFTFDVNADAFGENSFDLEVVSGNSLAALLPVSVMIEEGSSGSGFDFGDNWYLWLIGALNVILVIIIIVVAVRIARK